ncbi:MAG: hypothetical protein ACK4K7_02695 [Allosphingosinicella sp.]|uniref:hypothetical protein n=1 Tax=Allosphingosinicella sp. TaxID=2823234 RepID=UPI00393C1CE4
MGEARFRHSGEGRNLSFLSRRRVEIPAFAGMTMTPVIPAEAGISLLLPLAGTTISQGPSHQ